MDRLDCNTLFLLHHCEYILHTRSYYQKVTYRSTCPVWQAAPTLANSFLHVASTRQPTPCWICQKYKKVFIGHIPPCRHCNLQPPGPLFAAFFQSFFINSCTDLQLSRVTGGGIIRLQMHCVSSDCEASEPPYLPTSPRPKMDTLHVFGRLSEPGKWLLKRILSAPNTAYSKRAVKNKHIDLQRA